ncbi:MAG: ribosome small subunit-dependent GTPase A [Opitutales bacterium]
MSLLELGWSSPWADRFQSLPPAPDWQPARVIRQDRGVYTVMIESGPSFAAPSGRLLNETTDPLALPAVGDWVALEAREGDAPGRLHAVLPRQSRFVRKVAGRRSAPQLVAANVDRLFLVTGLDENFNLRRIERYLLVASQSGAEPVIVLNKLDLCADPESTLEAVAAIAGGAPVIALSATRGDGVDALRTFLRPAQTAAVLGSSGVGKSTLLNALLGEARQLVQANRADDHRGRHTTTARELFILPDGSLLIDTPGMRELGLVAEAGTDDPSFALIDELASACRFRDCQHGEEPGCAVRAAIAAGTLEAAQLEHWRRLRREQAVAARQAEARLQREGSRRGKPVNRRPRPRPPAPRPQADE